MVSYDDSPHTRAKNEGQRARRQSLLTTGVVTETPADIDVETDDDVPRGPHAVRIRYESGNEGYATVPMSLIGEYGLPQEDDLVLVARGAAFTPIVLGSLYVAIGDDPTYPPLPPDPDRDAFVGGERYLSVPIENTEAYLWFDEHGDVRIGNGNEREDVTPVPQLTVESDRITVDADDTDTAAPTVTVDGSTVTVDVNGTTLTVEDGSVSVNGGSTGVVTDVTETTTTDSDGHVTDVSLNITRSSDLFVP